MPSISGYRRGEQPRCAECHHSASFHGVEQSGPCRALGCRCSQWAESSFTVAEVASILGKSEDYVRDHARALGGRKVSKRWSFPLSDFERGRVELLGDPASETATPA